MSLSVSIKKKFRDFNLDVNFENDGDYFGILGPSGSGKSMTLKCIAGLETPDEGRIIFNDRVLFDSQKNINIKPQDRKIGYLFQSYALFPNMTAEQNIACGLKSSKEDKKIKIRKMLELFHLDGLERKYMSQLSGGQQQRVALARIFAYEPEALLLDEPFSALDSHLKEELQTEVFEFLKLYKGHVLMVTHQRDEVYKFCKNLAVLNKGKSIIYGDTKVIFNEPRTVEAAKIIGCNNISPCRIISPGQIFVNDWDIVLQTEKSIPENITHVGIKAHSFKIADNNDDPNTMDCEIINITDELFEYSIAFKNRASENSKKLIYKIKKNEWDSRTNNVKLFLQIPEESIFMLT
ncbi:sulfate/molybdate ABC transporter ATP-binding protein [Sedimentibacter sp.]|uniref:sulfate/molybdate ABC transporter ATP-binding protein n=1 Tax=Sedimentibacter sp. TaxID=1960295 RepID=UPI00289B6F57|nr:sulfate/molybdate ABC transporter ATP-binding protein [Sedimentibacter sp.]